MMSINTNLASLSAQRNLAKTQNGLAQAIQRLSSGLRVNSGKDDAAGLAISERFRAQVNGQEVAKRNANDGISFLETADGGLSSVGDSLQRMRELAVQARNGTLGANDRANLDLEFQALNEEIVEVLGKTKFNGLDTLGADGAALEIQVSDKQGDVRTFDLTLDGTETISTALKAGGSIDITTLDLASAANADTAMTTLDSAIDAVTSTRARVGTGVSRLESIVSNLDTSIAAISSARGRIIDADFAKETAALTRAQILQQAGTTVLSQANQLPSNVLALLR